MSEPPEPRLEILDRYRRAAGPPPAAKAQNWAQLTSRIAAPPATPFPRTVIFGATAIGVAAALLYFAWPDAAPHVDRATPEPVAAAPAFVGIGHLPGTPVPEPAAADEAAAPLPTPERSRPRAARRASETSETEGETETTETTETLAPIETNGLAEEIALLQRARRALARGDAAAALSALDEHAARFPGGTLAPERAHARVSALCLAGRRAEAETEAERLGRTPAVLRALARCEAP